jgi:hypothetical protein
VLRNIQFSKADKGNDANNVENLVDLKLMLRKAFESTNVIDELSGKSRILFDKIDQPATIIVFKEAQPKNIPVESDSREY